MFTRSSKNADLFLLVTVFYVVGVIIIVFKTLGYRSEFPAGSEIIADQTRNQTSFKKR